MGQHQCHSKEHLAGKINFLDSSERKTALPPEKLLKSLPIKKGDTILDFGAGTGYLTIPAAEIVDGLVYALDLDPHMLEIINSKAHDKKLANIQTVQGNINHIPLPDNSIDIVLASLVLHEVKPLATTLQQINQVLKKGGYFVCVEIETKEVSNEGPPRIPSSIMEQELINAGFSIIKKSFPTDSLYIFIVKK